MEFLYKYTFYVYLLTQKCCTTTKINIFTSHIRLISQMMKCDNVDEKTAKLIVRMDHCRAHHHPVHSGQCHGGDPHPEHLPRQVHCRYQ